MTNVALLGLGNAARTIWTPALCKVPGVTLVAGADPDASAQSAWSRLAPSAAPHPSLEELLDSHRSIDWLVIATPPAHHLDHVIAGLEAGCHVLCEKPLVVDEAALDAITKSAARARRTVAVNHEFTRMPIFAETLARLHAGKHGALRFAQLWQLVDDSAVTGWRSGGETLREFGTHAIDLLISAFGGPPKTVSARMPQPVAGEGGDPVDIVTLEWADGRSGHVVLDRISPGHHRYLEARFDCAEASLRASIGGRAALTIGLDAPTRRPKLRLDVAAGGTAWVEQGERRSVYARNGLHALVDATALLTTETFENTRSGKPAPCSLSRARDVLRVVEGAYLSASTDRVVHLGR